jgi:hypothetical protein
MKCFLGLMGGSLGSFSVSGSSKSESPSGLYGRSEELLAQKLDESGGWAPLPQLIKMERLPHLHWTSRYDQARE